MHFPHTRLRRNRNASWIRDLCADVQLSIDDFIYPIFISDTIQQSQPIQSMPGISRYGIDSVLKHIEPFVHQGLKAVAIFPVIDNAKKSLDARESWNDDGLVPLAVQKIKKAYPHIGVITDVALDPYTSHGQDGVIDTNGYVLNDETIEILVKQALSHAHAGADVVAPSDMMDGRILHIRKALEANGFPLVKILAYSVKYASSLYGPFREAVQSVGNLGGSNKKSYQLDYRGGQTCLLEAQLDIQEGADIIMVKPASLYLDIVQKLAENVSHPIFAYQVSGEYSQIMAAVQNGWLAEECIYESLIAIKRAGASAVLSYFLPVMIANLSNNV